MTKQLSGIAGDLYAGVSDLPIVSPHGHTLPEWFGSNRAFSDPAELLIIPDHYVFRMLYSCGIAMEDLGIGVAAIDHNPRAIFRLLAANWHLFLGTPSRAWLEHTLAEVFGIEIPLNAENSDAIYDQIDAALKLAEFRPHALLKRFDVEWLATTDGALDDLKDHLSFAALGHTTQLIPTFRPDAVIDPSAPNFKKDVEALGALTGEDIGTFSNYKAALASRRAYFKQNGATATDHAISDLATEWLDANHVQDLLSQALQNKISTTDAIRFYNHMLIEMAQMSVEDGLVMQLHAGSRRSTNHLILDKFGRDMGADIPRPVDWVHGLEALLNRVGNDPRMNMIAFTLDESGYARELAPMVGHWPALKLGPPWWFHDSSQGIARYLDQVVETSGYYNLAGFNDDTRALMSIPARHDLWRREVATHLAIQVGAGKFGVADAHDLARWLSYDAAKKAYKLGTD